MEAYKSHIYSFLLRTWRGGGDGEGDREIRLSRHLQKGLPLSVSAALESSRVDQVPLPISLTVVLMAKHSVLPRKQVQSFPETQSPRKPSEEMLTRNSLKNQNKALEFAENKIDLIQQR